MSAFMLSPEHITELVAFAVSIKPFEGGRYVEPGYLEQGSDPPYGHRSELEIAQHFADILNAEMWRSVSYRYEHMNLEEPEPLVLTYRMLRRNVLKPIDLVKMCHCYEYQACETPEWKDSRAKRLVELIERAAIRSMPGYENANWAYTTPKAA